MWPAVRHARGEMGYVEIAEPSTRHMRSAIDTGSGRHSRHFHRTNQTAEVEQIGLNDLHTVVFDHPAETSQAALLLAARNRNFQCAGDLLRLVIEIERYRLFKESELVRFHHPANLYCHWDIVRAVGVGVNRHPVAERFTR